jgi:hypothetical protein
MGVKLTYSYRRARSLAVDPDSRVPDRRLALTPCRAR